MQIACAVINDANSHAAGLYPIFEKKQAFVIELSFYAIIDSGMKQTKKQILVITLGGTIESHYDPAKGTPKNVPQEMGSYIPQALDYLGLSPQCETHFICLKDSKKVNADDLRKTANIIKNHPNFNKVVVVQGTDTMPDNARDLEHRLRRLGVRDKTLIFTGAMEPLRDEKGQLRENSDGLVNLKQAFEAAQNQPAGSYVVIDHQCRKADDISKFVVTDDQENVRFSGFDKRVLKASKWAEKLRIKEWAQNEADKRGL